MGHNFNQTKFNRRYCFTCNQEQRKDRGEWGDWGPLSVCPDACNAEKKHLLSLIYTGQDDPKVVSTKENNKPDSSKGSYATLRIAHDDIERDILNRIYDARDVFNDIVKKSGVDYRTDVDLLYADEVWLVEAAGITCRFWARDGYDGGTSFYSADMLGTEWKHYTTKKANEFIVEQRRIRTAREKIQEDQDRATYHRLARKYNGAL